MKKRWIASMLFIAMLITMVPMAVQAEERAPEVAISGEYEGFAWEIKDRVLTISGIGEMPVWENYDYPWKDNVLEELYDTVVISEGITSVADMAFTCNNNLKKVSLPASVKKIGSDAFWECYSLEEVVFSEGLEEIGAGAFYFCAIKSLRIPSTLKVIGQEAFRIAGPIEELYIPSIEMWMNVSIEGFYHTSPAIYADKIYIDGELTTTILIPEGVTKIGDAQFSGFDATSAYIPNSVTEVGEAAFYYNSNMESLVFPAGVQKIGPYNFDDGNDSGEGARPEGFPKVMILNPDCVIDEEQYYHQSGTYLRTTVYGYAGSTAETVAAAYGLEFVEIVDYEDEYFDSVANPGEIMPVYTYPYVEDEDLLEDVYVDGRKIDKSCYIEDWEAPFALTAEFIATLSEGSHELLLCYDSQTLRVKFTVSKTDDVITSGEYEGFTWKIENRVLTISGIGEMPTWGDYDYPWKNRELQERYDTIVISDGVTSIADSAFFNTGVRKVIIASTVKRIGSSAFEYCSLMEEINIPEGVEEVGEFAYFVIGANSIRLPSTLKTIGERGFSTIGLGEDPAESLYIPSLDAWMNVTITGNDIYTNPMMTAQNVYFDGELLTDIVIPQGVTKIGYMQFCGFEGMTSLYIPDTVTEIGAHAFYCAELDALIFPNNVQSVAKNVWSAASESGKILVLNPACTIAEDQYLFGELDQETVVYGYAGSTAETVAAANELEFVAITDYMITLADDTVNPGQTLVAACDGSADKLDGVYVNRKRLDATCYTVNDDGTVTLTPEYLATLDLDSYELLLWYTDGVAFADFHMSSEEESTYTVSYHLVLGGDEVLESQTKTAGTSLTLRTEIPEMEGGWNFLGWDADGDDSTIEYLPGTVYTLDTDLALSGVWEDAYIGEIGVSYEAEVPIRFPGAGSDYSYTGVPTVVAFTPEAGFTYRISLPQAYSGRIMLYSNGNLIGQAMSSQNCVVEFDADGSRFDAYIYGPTTDFTGNIQLVIAREVIYGDVNSDGKVNAQDRMVLTRYLAGMTGYTADMIDMTAADVNCDGKVNTQDRMILTRYLAQWTAYPTLPYAT